MGFDINRFQGEVDEELVCTICSGVLEDPLQAPVCEHTFCRACIHEWISQHPTCPVDRQSVTSAQLRPVPRILRNLLSRLCISCENSTYGCTMVVKLDTLASHLEECEHNPKRPLTCEQGCGLVIPKDEIKDHNCFKELRALIHSQQQKMTDFQQEMIEQRLQINEQKRELHLLKDFMRAMRSSNPSMRTIADQMERDEVVRWSNTLSRARVMRWGGMISTPDSVLQGMVKRSLSECGCPPHIIDPLMENAHEQRWPKCLSSLETRQTNRHLFEQYVCKRLPGFKKSFTIIISNACFLMLQIPVLTFSDMETGSTFLAAFICFFRILHTLWHNSKVQSLVVNTRLCCMEYSQSSEKYREALDRGEKTLRVLTLFLISLGYFAGFLWFVAVFAQFAQDDYKLAFPMGGIEINNTPTYLVVLAFQFWIVILLTPLYIVLYSLYIGLIMLINSLLKMLKTMLLSVHDTDEEKGRQNIAICVQLHSKILKLGKELENLLSYVFLVEFTMIVIVVCQCSIHITEGSLSGMETLKFLFFITNVMLQLWLYCYVGDQLETYSSEISYAAYNCAWYKMSPSLKKNIILIMMRGQKPIKLTIGRMFDVTLVTYTKVLKFTYSVFALLNQAK